MLIGVLTVTAAVVVHGQLGHTARVSDRLVDTITPAQVEAGRLQMAMLDQESGVRGYALAGGPRFLQPYTDGLTTEQQSMARLRRLLADEPTLRADLVAVQRAIEAWRRDYGTMVISQVAEHGPGADAAATAARGEPAFDAVRASWATQNRDLAQARAAGRAELRDTRTARNWTLTALFAALLTVGTLLVVLLHYAVGRPLRMLRVASRQVADGDFTHVISAHGPADVRDVARAVEAMRVRIKRALDRSTERERTLQRQAAALDAQTAELRRSNAELEQFAYVASHDLQEPLRKVASFSQMLERRYADQLDDRARQYIGFAVDGAKRMQVLINDLLAFSRVGRMHRQQRLALREPLERALANLDDALASSGARVEVPGDLPQVAGDPTLLTMLWQNLVGNAVKFCPPDRDPVVRIACEGEDDQWHLTVTDNGIGIPVEYEEKIFVIFQRLHGRDSYSGTGIGLALCKKIVEYHGGRIWLDPEHRDGARFHLTLPALAQADTDQADIDQADPGRSAGPFAPPGTGTSGAVSCSTDPQGARS
ncbi:ATP-binding protein [Actinomadura sp. NPDC048394]|uniref:sensor histidine kinase n=1 Tax=Actinomadura sp. NPDC048394 TaxID=3158223 RepID=UPI0033CF9640